MISIITVVVRLSRLAEKTNVTTDNVQSIRSRLRVRNSWAMKSKHPLLLNISTIVIVASRNSTTSAAFPTHGMNTFCATNCLTMELTSGAIPFSFKGVPDTIE